MHARAQGGSGGPSALKTNEGAQKSTAEGYRGGAPSPPTPK